VQIAQLQQGETVERFGQFGNDYLVVMDLDGGGVTQTPAVQPQAAQSQADKRANRVPVLDVEESPASTENLRGVIGLDAEPLL